MIRVRTVFTAVLILLFLCSNAWAKLKVVCSIPDYCALTKAIGGDRVQVQSLTIVGQDPHYVEPKPSFVMHLYRADMLISNGLGLEIGWLPKLVVQARNATIQEGGAGRLVVANHVQRLLEVPTGRVERSQGDVHPGGNPHFYQDPVRMTALIPVFVSKLSRLSPKDGGVFQKNGRQLTTQLNALMDETRARFGRLSPAQRQVVTYHKSLSYLLASLGLKAAIYIEPKPGVAPTPSHAARVLSAIKRQSLKAIVQESYYPQKTSATLAKIARVGLVVIPGGTRANQTYLIQARATINSIYQGLTGGGSR